MSVKKYSCIAIDDDRIYTELMERYVEQIDFLDLKASYNDPLMGVLAIERDEPDLVFLDFEMPGINAFDTIQAVEKLPAVVVISSHWEHEAELLELGVKKFVAKPIKSVQHLASIAKEALGLD